MGGDGWGRDDRGDMIFVFPFLLTAASSTTATAGATDDCRLGSRRRMAWTVTPRGCTCVGCLEEGESNRDER